MRKTISLLALLMFTGFASGVVGANCPPGQPCIMSGGENDTSTAQSHSFEPITKNGSDWSVTLKLESMKPSDNVSERLVNASYSSANGSKTVNFTGVMQTNSPAYRPELDVTETENGYLLDVTAVKVEDNNSLTTQVLTEQRYSVEFQAENAFNLEVTQGNLSETFQHPDFEARSEENNGGGLFSGFINWLSSLF